MSNALVLTSLLLGLLDRSTQISALLNKAQKEGRDVTAEELDALFANDAASRAALQVFIDQMPL